MTTLPSIEELRESLKEGETWNESMIFLERRRKAAQTLLTLLETHPDIEGVIKGTHWIAPVEPTEEMLLSGLIGLVAHIEERNTSEDSMALLEKYKDDPIAMEGLKGVRMGAAMRNSGEIKTTYQAMRSAYKPEKEDT
jgi:hypothetical protein